MLFLDYFTWFPKMILCVFMWFYMVFSWFYVVLFDFRPKDQEGHRPLHRSKIRQGVEMEDWVRCATQHQRRRSWHAIPGGRRHRQDAQSQDLYWTWCWWIQWWQDCSRGKIHQHQQQGNFSILDGKTTSKRRLCSIEVKVGNARKSILRSQISMKCQKMAEGLRDL